jgi:hypothetical protein
MKPGVSLNQIMNQIQRAQIANNYFAQSKPSFKDFLGTEHIE